MYFDRGFRIPPWHRGEFPRRYVMLVFSTRRDAGLFQFRTAHHSFAIRLWPIGLVVIY
jgi:hypothetical protein